LQLVPVNYTQYGTSGGTGRFAVVGVAKKGGVYAIGEAVVGGIVEFPANRFQEIFCLIFMMCRCNRTDKQGAFYFNLRPGSCFDREKIICFDILYSPLRLKKI